MLAVGALTVAASPTPAPRLESMLAGAPAGYVEDTESSGTPIGRFDAGAYVGYLAPDDPAAMTVLLRRDGFVAGWGKSWTQQGASRGLVELVVAFSGGLGARHWLTETEIGAKQDQFYKGDITVGGLGPYVGIRYVDPKGRTEADVVSFVKGNDYFLVGYISAGEDLTGAAASQSQLQYDFAASESIPRSEWPETPRSPSPPPAWTLVFVAGPVLLAAVALAFVWVRRRRRSGSEYWDGQTWRSSDGRLWWDGETWRPVPPAG